MTLRQLSTIVRKSSDDCNIKVPKTKLDTTLAKLHLARVYEIHRANSFIVDSLDNIGGRTKFAAILVGGVISLMGYIIHRGTKTPAAAYHKALSQSRRLWLSPGFCTSAIIVDSMRTLEHK